MDQLKRRVSPLQTSALCVGKMKETLASVVSCYIAPWSMEFGPFC